MLKKTITFEDLDGNKLTEDFYFNLNKAELTEMQLSQKGGLEDYIKKILATEDHAQLVALFKELIVKSVGRRSEDGRRFIKNQEVVDDFVQTNAYSELFMELATQTDAAVEFISGVIPSDLAAEVEKTNKTETVALPAETEPAWLRENREPTQAELRDASPEQLRIAFQRKQAQS